MIMANKLMLNTFIEEDFDLIAIPCSLEAYHLSFLLNKTLNFRLHREDMDVDFTYKEGTAFYELFKYCDDYQQCNYYLVENKHKIKSLGGLYVIGTERMESRRVDNQARGRAGRQGDEGSSIFL